MNSNSTNHQAREHSKLLEKIFQLVNDQLLGHLGQMLQRAPDLINARAERCDNHNTQQALFALYRFIKEQGSDLNREFFVALNNKIRPRARTAENGDEELSLVSQDEMEEMVALTTLHAHAINRYGEQVDHLEARLEYIEITSLATLDKECLNPIRLGEAFQDSLKAFPELSLEDRLELYKLFESEVILQLENMYAAINQLLILADILPTITLKTSRATETDEDVGEIKLHPGRTENTQHQPAQFPTARSPRDIRYLANQMMSSDFVAPQDAVHLPQSFRRPVCKKHSDGTNYYDRKDVLKALSRLQNRIINGECPQQPETIEHIKRALLSDMGAQEGGVVTRQVNVLDERSIDFVGMMFDAITEDDNITVVIKNLLLRLQIPVIKVAMSDKHLFEREDHPARQVLDLITDAGKGVVEESDPMFSSLNTVVDDLLREYDIDVASFRQAAATLHELLDSETQQAQQVEQQEQKQVIFNNAREVIVDEVRHITRNQRVPQNVLPLVTKNWPSLMINRYVKYGKESWFWLESVMLMKLMIKCLQPIQSTTQWQTVWRNHLALVDAVHDELCSTRQKKNAIDEQINHLKTTFIELLDAYGFRLIEECRVSSLTMFDEADTQTDAALTQTAPEAANDPVQYDADELRKTHIAEVAELAHEKISRLPSDVHPGVWFELYNGEDRAIRRLKLSVVLTEVAKLIFVDRKGVKVMEKDAGEFAEELKQQRSRFIADHSTFEHALGKVIGALAA